MAASNRFHFLTRAATALLMSASFVTTLPAIADPAYPQKPIKMVLGYPTGGAADATFRSIQRQFEKELGQIFLIDYKPGAGATIAAETVLRAPPDGYTLHLIDSGPMTIAPLLKKQRYDPMTSFTPIAMVALGGNAIVVNGDYPGKNLDALLAEVRSKPDQLSYGTSGVGGVAHLSAELFQVVTKTKMQHVPYKGGAPALTELMGGQIPVLFGSLGSLISHAKAGKVKVLAVTSGERSSALPDVPTLAELGIPVEGALWWALVGPPNLPPAIATKVNDALRRTLENPAVKEALSKTGYDPWYHPAKFVMETTRKDLDKWGKVIRDANVTLE